MQYTFDEHTAMLVRSQTKILLIVNLSLEWKQNTGDNYMETNTKVIQMGGY